MLGFEVWRSRASLNRNSKSEGRQAEAWGVLVAPGVLRDGGRSPGGGAGDESDTGCSVGAEAVAVSSHLAPSCQSLPPHFPAWGSCLFMDEAGAPAPWLSSQACAASALPPAFSCPDCLHPLSAQPPILCKPDTPGEDSVPPLFHLHLLGPDDEAEPAALAPVLSPLYVSGDGTGGGVS